MVNDVTTVKKTMAATDVAPHQRVRLQPLRAGTAQWPPQRSLSLAITTESAIADFFLFNGSMMPTIIWFSIIFFGIFTSAAL
jgi:hypothetical protein